MPDVNVVCHAALSRHREEIKHLGSCRRRHVVDPEADAECAFIQSLLDKILNLADLFGCSYAVSRVVTWKEGTSIFHDSHLRRDMADCSAEVDQRFAFALCVPRGYRRYVYFHFQRRCHTVARFVTIVLVILPVRMQINETRSNDKTLRIDHCASAQRPS